MSTVNNQQVPQNQNQPQRASAADGGSQKCDDLGKRKTRRILREQRKSALKYLTFHTICHILIV